MRAIWLLAAGPIALVLWAVTQLIVGTSRIAVPRADAAAVIHVNWHRHLPLLMWLHGRTRGCMMMSPSPHMAPIAWWCRLLGMRLVRGTSGAGGRAALADLESSLRRGESVVLAVDGPGGPPFVVKPGCVDLALATGAPIVGLAYRGRGAFTNARRWDRQLLARPFASLEIVRDEVRVQPGESREALLARVQAMLERLDAM